MNWNQFTFGNPVLTEEENAQNLLNNENFYPYKENEIKPIDPIQDISKGMLTDIEQIKNNEIQKETPLDVNKETEEPKELAIEEAEDLISKQQQDDERRYTEEEQQKLWEREDKIRKETQEREDTAYQRMVEDMRKAGINPNLINAQPSASGGGITSATKKDESLNNTRLKIASDYIRTVLQTQVQKGNLIESSISDLMGGILKGLALFI